MEFEWSEAKRLKVLSDRGLDFADARKVFDGRPVLSVRSPRNDEERWINVAELDGRMTAVVWCRRDENARSSQ